MNVSRKFIQTIVFTAIFTAVPMTYNSCSSDHKTSSDEFESSLKVCDLSSYYARTWHPFVQRQCASCHYTGGEGNGAFADKDLSNAYQAFQLKGFSTISRYAKDPGHKPPYTGLQNTEEVNNLTKRWADAKIEAEKNCGESAVSDGRVKEDFSKWMRTTSKAVGGSQVGDTMYIEWNLDKELLPENIPEEYVSSGAKFGISIAVVETEGDVYYEIFDPILDMDEAVTDLRIEGIAFRLNGVIIDNQTTFYKVNETRYIKDRDNEFPISSGAMIAMGVPRSSDVISLQIKDLENLNLGPQPDGVKVFISDIDRTVSEAGTYTFTVNLSAPVPTTEVSVAIEDTNNTDAIDEDDRMKIKNKDDLEIEVKLFDWDYRIIDRNVIFDFGETTSTFRVWIRPDARHEPGDESFNLKLGVVNGPAEADTNRDSVKVTIDEGTSDPAPLPGEVTYSMLMAQPSGPFFSECIKCHNSTDAQVGGYDITDYDNMISDGIVIPEDYLSSKMHIRLMGGNAQLPRMPISSSLDSTQIQLIRKWIGDGGVATDPFDGSPIYPGSAKND